MAESTPVPDFIAMFADEIMSELGIQEVDQARADKLRVAVRDRVTARVFLELVATLSPEEAMRVSQDMGAAQPDPAETVRRLVRGIPDFSVRVAQICERIKAEIVEDLRPLAGRRA